MSAIGLQQTGSGYTQSRYEDGLSMRRFIMTGTPGSGKTSILRALENLGYAVVEEAATDVIAAEQAQGNREAWRDPLFIDAIVQLQSHRQHERVREGAAVQVHDRSVVCTLALARWLGYPVTVELKEAVAQVTDGARFDRRVFFVRPLGFCEPTPARRISYEDSLAFERVHETEYLRLGFDLVDVPPGLVQQRAALIDDYLRSWLVPR
jgi:predicted ATPase